MSLIDKFYKTKAWKAIRIVVLQRDKYLCQECLRNNTITPATMVHHKKHLRDYPDLGLEEDNLESLCDTCHNKEHPEKGHRKQKKQSKSRKIRVIEI